MLLIVGLGNPGPEYEDNRHNAGFMAADAIMRRHGFSKPQKKFHGLLAEGNIGGEKALCLKPQTYMNRSGIAVGEAAQFYKVAPENICVIHDELDLPLGEVKLKLGGGPGGHNGLKSIDGQLGRDYMRLRIGIGHPGDREQVTGHVLDGFSKAEMKAIAPILEAIADHLSEEIARMKAAGSKQIKFVIGNS